MQISGSKVLIFGGWGLVGSAICHKLMLHNPAEIVVSSLHKHEAEEAVKLLRKEYKNVDPLMFIPKWGNIFTRNEFKDSNWSDVLNDVLSRKTIIGDIYNSLDEEILKSSALYTIISEVKPDLVIDCINTATAIAYQNVYSTVETVMNQLESKSLEEKAVECMISSMYIPQLIRHIQIVKQALADANSKMYLKVGTSGTGGMGLNIPYTHSEEKPSRVLMAKSAVGGAQSLLLFLMARTPGGPIIKEIKPTAAIAWKKIEYGTVMRKGKPIPLVDLTIDKAHEVKDTFKFGDTSGVVSTGENFKSVFIDTGENGIFSKGEFQAIGSLGQMEIVTPEEIAECVVFEVLGGNTGRDVIQGLDSTTLGPTYRGGMLYNNAVKKIEALEKQYNIDSVAFEMLGPPGLSKLLYEANIIKRIANSMKNFINLNPVGISGAAKELIANDSKLRSEMLSIGLVVLLPDGKSYLRGNDVKIPVKTSEELATNEKNIEKWCREGWVDLRPSNFERWQERFNSIIKQAESINSNDTSSRYTYTKDYWCDFETIDEGKLVGWIFEFEDKGWRFKR